MGFLAFLSGPWGALIQKGLMVISIGLAAWILITQYNHHLTETQALKDQNAQLVQLEKDNQALTKKMNALSDANVQILLELDKQNQKVIQTHDKVTTYIQSPEGQKSNRQTSDVIRNTIGMLQNEE